ncbi:MAG: hypothetical protein Q9M50_00980 [Methylococcales bacterium]|nr:hypothetical protein [Methylococcales bacterium]
MNTYLGFLLLLLSFNAHSFEYIDKEGKKREMPELHHILDVKLLETMRPPKEFEVSDDRTLQCVTCHGTEEIETLAIEDVDKEADNFLRGGRYRKLTDFCYNCHQKKANTRNNIHILLDENDHIIEHKCKYCHEEVQDQNEAKLIDEVKLRLPAEILCYGCHLKTPHLNTIEHLVELKDKKLEQWKYTTKEKNIYMPLTKKGKIMCITCHAPHQKGILKASLPAAKQVEDVALKEGVLYQKHPWADVYKTDKKVRLEAFNQKTGENLRLEYKRIKAEVLLRLPAKNGELCLSCHTFDY